VPTPEEHEAQKAELLKKDSGMLKKTEAAKTPLGEYLTKTCEGEWEGSVQQKEYINMQWVAQKHVVLSDFTEFRVLGKGTYCSGAAANCCRAIFLSVIISSAVRSHPGTFVPPFLCRCFWAGPGCVQK
jgi:hypothetical protein